MRRALGRWLLTLALGATCAVANPAAAATAGGSSSFQGGPAHDGDVPEPLAPPLRTLWSVRLTDPSYAVTENGRLFVVTNVPGGDVGSAPDGVLLHAFDLHTGRRLWGPVEVDPEAPGPALRGTLVVRSGIVVAHRGFAIEAYAAHDGRRLWSRPGGTPAVAGDLLYAVDPRWPAALQALDLRSGAVRWSTPLTGFLSAGAPPSVVDGRVLAATPCGMPSAYDARTGRRLWGGEPRCEDGGGPTTAVSAGRLYTRQGPWSAIWDAATGARLGTFRTGTVPAFGGGRMFVVAEDTAGFLHDTNWNVAPGGRAVSAHDPATGRRLWRTELPYDVLSAPLAVGDLVYVGGRDESPDRGRLRALRQSDGVEVWSLPLPWTVEHPEEWHGSSPLEGLNAAEGLLTVPTAQELSVLAPAAYRPPPAAPRTPLDEHYDRLGGPRSPLGPAMSGVLPATDGRGRHLSCVGGVIYWSPATGAREVHGAILDRWLALGGTSSALGYPTSDELPLANGRGRWSAFQHGRVYWSPSTGAHEVRGAILDRYRALGGTGGLLGHPVTDELPSPDGRGRYSHFEHGSIYWSPATGAHEVHGAIRDRWRALGWEASALGYPVTDELVAPDGRGRYVDFERGSVYWSPQTGAHEVRGAIRQRWLALGGVRSRLGYPTSDEIAALYVQYTTFRRGEIWWFRDTGEVRVRYY